jgi:hypothetical protein
MRDLVLVQFDGTQVSFLIDYFSEVVFVGYKEGAGFITRQTVPISDVLGGHLVWTGVRLETKKPPQSQKVMLATPKNFLRRMAVRRALFSLASKNVEKDG